MKYCLIVLQEKCTSEQISILEYLQKNQVDIYTAATNNHTIQQYTFATRLSSKPNVVVIWLTNTFVTQ